ncbi:unnamed protein product [Pedinophyceae sp. YPF-701]|nr:unnamed protein product [Pedinophyceae sp. YPF-701]
MGSRGRATRAASPTRPARTKTTSAADKHQVEYEFMGPYVGPLGVMIGLPVVCYALYLACGPHGCSKLYPWGPALADLSSVTFYSTDGFLALFGYVAAMVALHLLLPGAKALGVVLPDGSRLQYKLNALYCCIAMIAAFAYLGGAPLVNGKAATPYVDLGWVYDNYLPLLTASVALSASLSLYLYLTSFKRGAMLAAHGNTGATIYDFFIGRELNPRIGSLDLKEFCELYPGIIGWVLINGCMAVKQATLLGRVTNSMVLVNIFQLIYAVDALWFEKAILTTMDITTDGFGFMLAFGDLTWVPFTYTLQARYLVDHPLDLPTWGVCAIVALKVLGYVIFRGSNSQKDTFRRDPEHPSVAALQTLQTQRGRKLLIDGWWGVARHINYTGDWLMGVAWCLPCGFDHAIPYFYAVYFAVLLLHRDARDFHACKQKYGKDWDKYCSIVKYSLVPYVY